MKIAITLTHNQICEMDQILDYNYTSRIEFIEEAINLLIQIRRPDPAMDEYYLNNPC